MNKWKRVLLGVGLLVAVLLVLPWLIPMSKYIAQAEQLASAQLGVPVTIGGLRIALLPSPRLVVERIAVGQDQLLSAERVVVVPALSSVFSASKTISSVKIIKPVVKQEALSLLTGLGGSTGGTTAVSVRHIDIKDAMLVSPGLQLPAWNAEIALSAANQPESVHVESTDGKLEADLKPADGYRLVVLNASDWTLPAGPPLLIDELKAEMALYDNRLEIRQLDAKLYQGKISATATLNWASGWRLSGKANVDDLAVQKPARLMSRTTHVSGNLFGHGNFSASAKTPAALLEQLDADFRFKVEHGVLYGVDLAKAASLLLSHGQKGGETRFDTLSGVLKASGKRYQLRDLKVSSGLIAANGFVKIEPNKQLDGVINVELKSSMSLAAVPLQVSGTINDPVVLPTKAAMAGAVAGTAILGPGVGTSLGIKAGSAIDKIKGLFGSSDE